MGLFLASFCEGFIGERARGMGEQRGRALVREKERSVRNTINTFHAGCLLIFSCNRESERERNRNPWGC